LSDKETPEFIPSQPGPPNSPDLNPVDYSVSLQQKVCTAMEWTKLDHIVIAAAIRQWRRR